ncbi:MAG: hypothetical protein JNM76_02505 [Betaproteobacteria bacterium]|nr:hypothetical protein [Betaproteobacteria bacterium]
MSFTFIQIARAASALATLAILHSPPSLANSAATITNFSVSPQEAKQGDVVTATVMVKGVAKPTQCNVAIKVIGAGGKGVFENTLVKVGGAGDTGTGTLGIKIDVPGDFVVQVGPGMSDGGAGPCLGNKEMRLKVNLPPPPVTLTAPVVNAVLICPTGYEKKGGNSEKGEIKCVKVQGQCPEDYKLWYVVGDGGASALPSLFSPGTMVCVRKPGNPECPPGYQGGKDSKEENLVYCAPDPQPTLPCPTATPQWKWGSMYFKQGWQVMGCTANVEPAK